MPQLVHFVNAGEALEFVVIDTQDLGMPELDQEYAEGENYRIVQVIEFNDDATGMPTDRPLRAY